MVLFHFYSIEIWILIPRIDDDKTKNWKIRNKNYDIYEINNGTTFQHMQNILHVQLLLHTYVYGIN